MVILVPRKKKIVVVQSLSHIRFFTTPWTQHTRLPCPSLSISQSLFKLMSIELVMLSSNLILCHSLLFLPLIFTSIMVFSSELAVICIRWPKYWCFSFSISPPSEYSGLISFRIDWFDLLAVQGTLKSLPQHHNSKASILWHFGTAFLMVQLSYLYMTAGKNSFDYTYFVWKLMSLFFNMLSRFVIAFLPRSKWFLISWLQSESTVILEPKMVKSATFSIFSLPIALMW